MSDAQARDGRDMDCNGCEYDPQLHYDSEFQVWIRAQADGLLLIGMTDLSQTIAGRILHVRVRKPGSLRPAGKPVATVETGKWAGPVPNVFDCEIVEGNAQVLDQPSLINADPYGQWIARVRPAGGAQRALSGLPTGEAARRAFCERARSQNIRCKRIQPGAAK